MGAASGVTSVYNHTISLLDGSVLDLRPWRSHKVSLFVNVASKCGFTKQYSGLQALHTRYQAQGLQIVGFPCNAFLSQEPWPDDQILDFVRQKYNVTFPLTQKISVNGGQTHPIWKTMKEQAPGMIKWNFEKFLIDPEGRVVKRYNSYVAPESIESDIQTALGAMRSHGSVG